MNELDALAQSAREAFAAAATPADLENAKAQYIGKSGRITELMKGLSALPVDEKKTRGAQINVAKQAIEAALTARRQALADAELELQLKAEALDVTLPGRQRGQGSLHPVSLTQERIEAVFGSMGFDVAEGPEIESDWFSFTSLNSPPNHPARSMQDTFYVEGKGADGISLNLRPHTSPMQVRYVHAHVRKHGNGFDPRSGDLFGGDMPEVRVIAPGRTYRVDSDATHSPMFHQCEGLWVGENVSFKDLKVVFTNFCRTFFESEDLVLRFRPSFFPFTEPSAEIDIQFQSGAMAGRWLEVAGSGQVHPNVIRNMGLDPERYIGFAFGMGMDRFTMLRYGVNDLRLFFDGDVRFLSQFK
ncbi:phenylalanine--tRNA ligase subunit alpha [Hydrogenophaga crassostreae]|uniref:Phenylalanine--tRNA ligase alpha subunit n=1 Tax=Hydrogenophaga crassostreae TaxID=1763535 RepID=A0A163CG35_9BURK|nr:phenylalanine--tRNA ligase subunit alpha [Hydrogenophaga crassostreae]AOW13672.1 phenylalanine--tRNA ligase subunit alpha [Hydrogenophaga crassostreae]OAD41968.1 phenylalanine--tRNA ligase subunit alpha [Hydrogenophaga crassostreae]